MTEMDVIRAFFSGNKTFKDDKKNMEAYVANVWNDVNLHIWFYYDEKGYVTDILFGVMEVYNEYFKRRKGYKELGEFYDDIMKEITYMDIGEMPGKDNDNLYLHVETLWERSADDPSDALTNVAILKQTLNQMYGRDDLEDIWPDEAVWQAPLRLAEKKTKALKVLPVPLIIIGAIIMVLGMYGGSSLVALGMVPIALAIIMIIIRGAKTKQARAFAKHRPIITGKPTESIIDIYKDNPYLGGGNNQANDDGEDDEDDGPNPLIVPITGNKFLQDREFVSKLNDVYDALFVNNQVFLFDEASKEYGADAIKEISNLERDEKYYEIPDAVFKALDAIQNDPQNVEGRRVVTYNLVQTVAFAFLTMGLPRCAYTMFHRAHLLLDNPKKEVHVDESIENDIIYRESLIVVAMHNFLHQEDRNKKWYLPYLYLKWALTALTDHEGLDLDGLTPFINEYDDMDVDYQYEQVISEIDLDNIEEELDSFMKKEEQ